jgi:hypothetical protein
MLIQIIFTLSFVLAILVTWRRARQNAISTLEAALWSVLWIGAGVVVWWPGVASFLASKVGVGRGADLVVYSSVVLLFWLIFRIFVRLESLEHKLTALVRAESLHEFDKDLQKGQDGRE